MTKSVIVSFDEADESFITALFKKMKMKVKPFPTDDDEYIEPTKAEILQSIKKGFDQVKAHREGNIKLKTADAFFAELAEEDTEPKQRQPA